jgi:uncharacterized protein
VTNAWYRRRGRAAAGWLFIPSGARFLPLFLDPSALTFWDPDHSAEEDREITIGRSRLRRVLFVAHAAREGRGRIISARRATRQEQKQYEEGIGEARE